MTEVRGSTNVFTWYIVEECVGGKAGWRVIKEKKGSRKPKIFRSLAEADGFLHRRFVDFNHSHRLVKVTTFTTREIIKEA